MTDARIAVATSIAPKDIETQKAAIATWRARDMRVLSVNCHAEAIELAPQFPGVDFIDVGELDTRHTTRKLVYFDQLLAALKQAGHPICGIINSDIRLRADKDLSHRLMELAAGGLVFGARTDIASAGDAAGETYAHGFDFFFFDRTLIDAYPASPFRLGAPWWDLWTPIVPLAQGLTIRRLVDPVALHVRHDSVWSQEQEWQTYGGLFMEAVSRLAGGGLSRNLPTGANADVWTAFCRILSDRLFAHYDLLTRSLPDQDPTMQALIRATNDQTTLIVGQAMRLLLERVVPAAHIDDMYVRRNAAS